MSPVQRIALGLLVVFAVALLPAHPHPAWATYDALPDPLGWLLVLTGIGPLSRREPALAPARWLCLLAAAVSVPLWFPQLAHQVTGAGVWAALLPQNLACVLLCRQIGRLGAEQDPHDTYVARRFGLLTWGFVVVTVLPAVVVGGDARALDPAANLVKYVVVVACVYFLFRVHRREYLGGLTAGRG